MSDQAVGGSSIGSPAAGAVAPSRMSDMGSGAAPATGARAMSDLGMPVGPGAAPPGEKMTPISGPFGETPAEPEATEAPNTQEAAEPEAEAAAEPEPGAMTPEQQAAKYQEWMDTDQIPEEFLDRPIWVPDGKGGQAPIRLRDVPNNVLMHNDYQRKTAEVAQMRRQNEQFIQGRQRWVEDMNSGDGERGMRAIYGIGAEKTLDAIIVHRVQELAMLEGMPPQLQQKFIDGEAAKRRAYWAEQQLQARQAQEQQAQQQQAQQLGTDAPDIRYVQDSISEQLPKLYKELRIAESPLVNNILSNLLVEACAGKRDPQTGQWIEPPRIQLGRAPSKAVLSQLLIAAKQQADSYAAANRGIAQPPTRPLQGSGPAAKPGQAGNLSEPARARFSDLAVNRRPV